MLAKELYDDKGKWRMQVRWIRELRLLNALNTRHDKEPL
jgi:hypothetical protein